MTTGYAHQTQQGYAVQYAQSAQQARHASMAAQHQIAARGAGNAFEAGGTQAGNQWMAATECSSGSFDGTDPGHHTPGARQIADAAALRRQHEYAAQQARAHGQSPQMMTYGGGTMHVHNERPVEQHAPMNKAPKARLHSAAPRHLSRTAASCHPLAHFFVAESTRAALQRRMELRYAVPNAGDPSAADLPQVVNDECVIRALLAPPIVCPFSEVG